MHLVGERFILKINQDTNNNYSYIVDISVSIRYLHRMKLVPASSDEGLYQRPKRQQRIIGCVLMNFKYKTITCSFNYCGVQLVVVLTWMQITGQLVLSKSIQSSTITWYLIIRCVSSIDRNHVIIIIIIIVIIWQLLQHKYAFKV